MFIRFKRVKLADNHTQLPRYSIHCVLVESFRIKGKPRQRVIKYLGSIREREFMSHSSRSAFTKRIEGKIDELELGPHVTARLKVQLIRKIVQYGRPFR